MDSATNPLAGIAGLAANTGTFVVSSGADFATVGSFANNGSLTVGQGSTLTMAGSFTQTSAGTLFDPNRAAGLPRAICS